MRKLLPILLLLMALGANAAVERITLTLTVTNVPVTGDNLLINSTLRYWTNASASGTILTNLVGINESATNLYDQITTYPYSGPLVLRWSDTNVITLTAPLGGALSASATGNWASLVLSTQSGPSTFTALWPIESMVGATNRTNQASSLVYGLGTYSTNAFATNSTAVTNLLVKGAVPAQTVSGAVTFGGLSGNIVALTNGYSTNHVMDSPTITNGVAYGLTINSGSLTGATQIALYGNGVDNLVRITGASSIAAVSPLMYLQRENGPTNAVDANDILGAIAFVGWGTTAVKSGARIRGVPIETFTDSTSGTDLEFATVPTGSTSYSTVFTLSSEGNAEVANALIAGSITNAVLRGTNILNGRLDLTASTSTSLANGNNSGVILGTNVYLQLSGATTIAAIAGFAAEQNGSYHVLQISGAVTNTLYNDSGIDATAANRIYTGTGGDISMTNSPSFCTLIYDSAASRWRVVSHSD